jgi:hypothetical protein
MGYSMPFDKLQLQLTLKCRREMTDAYKLEEMDVSASLLVSELLYLQLSLSIVWQIGSKSMLQMSV